MKKFRTGFVVGKFCPLHKGHILLINEAMKQCEELVVLSYTSVDYPKCSAANRRKWLQDTFPDYVQDQYSCNVRIVVLDNALNHDGEYFPADDAPGLNHRIFCASYLLNVLNTTAQAVFSSESYGYDLAEVMSEYFTSEMGTRVSVEHVMVDEARTQVRISGTTLRSMQPGLAAYQSGFLTRAVGCDLLPKVLILGGESSGKTTLCKALAKMKWSRWVPEFGRTLWEQRDGKLNYEDMEYIATKQLEMEDIGSISSHNVVFCDTSALTTMFYSKQIFGRVSPNLARMAKESFERYDAVYICDSNIAFDQDGTRRDEAFRSLAYDWYLESYKNASVPIVIVHGTVEERRVQVMSDLKNKGLL